MLSTPLMLPKELNYINEYSRLPSGTVRTQMVVSPSNGAIFGPSNVITFNLERRGYMVPESMYIRYNATYTARDTLVGTANFIRGTPVYTFIQKLETIVDGSIIELIQNYGQIANFLVNSKMNYAQKVGVASCYGYNQGAQTGFAFTFSTAAPNGQSLSTTTSIAPSTFSYSAPLGCVLSNSNNLVPLKSMQNVTIQLTTEAFNNVFSLDATHPISSYEIDDIQLCYSIIEFSPQVDSIISSKSPTILLKSQSYTNSAVSLIVNSIGSLEFLFHNRLASIKSVFALISGTDPAGSKNMLFDAIDCTANRGDYQWVINSIAYPTRPLSTLVNKSAILMELSSAFGETHNLNNTNFSINPVEFNTLGTTSTTQNQPGKFYLGVNCEQMSTSDSFLTGVSSQNGPIAFRISLGVTNTRAHIINQICLYDVILSIDTRTSKVSVMS